MYYNSLHWKERNIYFLRKLKTHSFEYKVEDKRILRCPPISNERIREIYQCFLFKTDIMILEQHFILILNVFVSRRSPERLRISRKLVFLINFKIFPTFVKIPQIYLSGNTNFEIFLSNVQIDMHYWVVPQPQQTDQRSFFVIKKSSTNLAKMNLKYNFPGEFKLQFPRIIYNIVIQVVCRSSVFLAARI